MTLVSKIFVGAALSFAAAASAHANLIQNGSFSSDFADWTAGSTWFIDTSNPESPPTDALGACGFTSDCLTNSSLYGLSQTIHEEPGIYQLRFGFAPGSYSPLFPVTLVADWDGTPVFDETFSTPTLLYTDYSVNVTGTGTDTVTFFVRNDTGASNLDSVGVPEPASLSLLGAGLALLGLRRRKRQPAA